MGTFKFWLIGIVFFLLIGLVGFRFYQITVFNLVNLGQGSESLNGRYQATIESISKESFWGVRTKYYEFQITNKANGEKLNYARMDSVEDKILFSVRGDDIISWSSNSSEAIFTGNGIKLILKVHP
ncbi:MAG: hypothetical protein AMJ43_09705 [Coxiella sp. DG_40]|nr:MAG: hypothetical protein AMJ43_09705 [Coxiella sp. DG_40]